MRLLHFLFGCQHVRMSFPQTDSDDITYVCCLVCGREFEYSWREMRIIGRKPVAKNPEKKVFLPLDNHYGRRTIGDKDVPVESTI